MRPDNQRVGTTAELAVAAKLNSLGYSVSWPLSPTSFDLIATTGRVSRRVQVKSAERGKSGTYKANLRKGRKNTRKYTADDCSSVVVYAPYHLDYDNEADAGYYVVPISEASKVCTCIVYPPTKGRYKHWVSKWERYREAWSNL